MAPKVLARRRTAEAEARARTIVADAEREGERKRKEAELEVKDMIFRAKAELEKEARERRDALQGLERRLLQREESLERKLDNLDRRDLQISGRGAGFTRRGGRLRGREKKKRDALG